MTRVITEREHQTVIANTRHIAHREGSIGGIIVGVCFGVAVMLGIHVALTMRATVIHESAQASIREADRVLGGDGHLVAAVKECRELNERQAGKPYVEVRDYMRDIDAKQGRAKR